MNRTGWCRLVALAVGIAAGAAAMGQTRPVSGLASGPASRAATHPASLPVAKLVRLHADAVASDEIDLYWYDFDKSIDRFLVERSTDGGKTWKPVGNEPAPSATGRFDHKDTNKLEPETKYEYELVIPETGKVVSEAVEATTQARNLIEAVKGESTVKISDIASVGFWRATLNAAIAWAESFIPSLTGAVVIYLFFYLIYRMARRLTVSSLKKGRVDPTIHDLLLTIVKWSILGFGLVVAGDQMGIHLTTLLTGISIMGLAIGFAAQDTLSNIIASVVIFWDKPFKVDDWITLNGEYGRVMRITFRTTRILNQNGDVIVTSNTAILGTQLVNHSINVENWVNIPITVPATTPIAKVRQVLLGVLAGDGRILKEPAAKVVVDSFDSGQTKLFLSFCIAEESYQLAIMQEYTEKAKNALDGVK